MRKTTEGIKGQNITVDTAELMNMLHVGRKSATDIGITANARITIGRRVLWNVKKVQEYLDEISE
ncbi:hypothetical protein [Lacrimispora sp.]|uniref:hypothetical protein n=1 Tax=Lacrimispora sp. TaxID=2719234 RepID=UPI0028AF5091|nr:hypothetical protein [Lacrimispora sp.]